MAYSKALLQNCDACDRSFLDEIITGVQTGVRFDEPERKAQEEGMGIKSWQFTSNC